MLLGYLILPASAVAQHAGDNAVTSAEDAFGLTKGTESVGIYDESSIRGFDPQQAGNTRIEGLYFDQRSFLGGRLIDGSVIRVGASAQGYSFPAPTGIVDYQLRDPGQKPGGTVVLYAGPYETKAIDADARLTLQSDLHVPFGASYRVDAALPGFTTTVIDVGAAPVWTPNDQVSVRAFFDWRALRDIKVQPQIYVTGPYAPPQIAARYFGQEWAKSNALETNAGLMTHLIFDQRWRLSAGVFRSTLRDTSISYTDAYTVTARDGTAAHVLSGYPKGHAVSISGEIRLTRRTSGLSWANEFSLSIRGRSSEDFYGGFDDVRAGVANVGNIAQIPTPEFRVGPLTKDSNRLVATGLAYHGARDHVGDITLGVQKISYSKQVKEPNSNPVHESDRPWRFYGAASVPISSRLAGYAGYTQGLEDAGIAPSGATNRGSVLAASRTWQRDAGLRLALTPNISTIIGVFDLRKPYFNLDGSGFYTIIGTQRNRGMEFSLVGQISRGLNLVAGAVFAKPEVTLAQSDIDSRAVGQSTRVVQITADYAWSRWPALSTQITFSNYGRRAAALNNSFELPGRSTWDLGARYQVAIGQSVATLRGSIQNVTNSFGWDLTEDGGFSPYPGRSYLLYLTIER